MWGHYNTTKLLLGKDCKKYIQNKDGNTPLHLAVLDYSCYSVAKLLIRDDNNDRSDDNNDSKRIISIKNKKGQTPHDVALECDKKDMAQLFENEIDPEKYSLLELVKLQNETKLKDLIIGRGKDVNEQTKIDKSTALHVAAQKGSLSIVKLLLEGKADTNQKDKWGKTPLHYSVQNSKEIAQLLLEQKCDINLVDNYGLTALYYAIQNGADDIVDVLINDLRCNVEQPDEDGCTPLHKAVFFGYKSVVKRLLDKSPGCKNKKDKTGKTPLDLATEWNFTEINLLLNNQ